MCNLKINIGIKERRIYNNYWRFLLNYNNKKYFQNKK